jgi:hypothetical protein
MTQVSVVRHVSAANRSLFVKTNSQNETLEDLQIFMFKKTKSLTFSKQNQIPNL